MPKNFVYFDLETQKSAGDVGGWDKKCDMLMSVGVTYSTKTGEYRVYGEAQVNDLIDELRRADLVIGYNHINFDYQVLMHYTFLDLPSQLISLDLCVDLEARINHRPKLDAIALASLGCGKTEEGLQAIRWWREGKVMEIARYCCFDVKVTKLVHEFGIAHGEIKYKDSAGHEKRAAVDWTGP
ncbi:MAG: ribonuclease H-like domain-containing protein [Verrucomicrobiota bacterium]